MKIAKTVKLDRLTQQVQSEPVEAYFHKQNLAIYNQDLLKIDQIESESIDLITTSPPYNIDVDYASNGDSLSYQQYLEFSKQWLSNCYQWSKSQGRLCLNIPLDTNKNGQKSIYADLTQIAKKVGWKYHSTIIWNESNISKRTAWGSWLSASAPYVIAPVETIVVLYKDQWKKDSKGISDISKQEFIEWTNGLWSFNGQSKQGAGGHPAAFPIELPKRCIKLFSFVGDLVLDPFMGSGTTLIASYLNKRQSIGIDIDQGYCDIAIKRLIEEAHIKQTKFF